MTISELNLSKSEEKTLRRIALGEPVGFAHQPLTGWTGIFITVAILLGAGLFFIWLFSGDFESRPVASLYGILLSLVIISHVFELRTRDRIIGKLYQALDEGDADHLPATGRNEGSRRPRDGTPGQESPARDG